MSTLKTNNIQHVDRSDPSIIISTDGGVSIAGTLTYEDVTNIDAVGIVTGRELINAQKQIHVGTGVSVKAGGLNVTAGITTVQALQATSGTFSAAVSGTTGTFSAAVSGTTGTFTGDVDIADKIVHTGDTNTAIRFPSADTITAETAGSERLRIDSSGNIGINNTNPSYILSVNGDSGINVTASSDSTEGVLSIVGKNSASSVSAISRFKSYPEGSGNQSHLAIETRNSSSNLVEALRITSNQNVGIATNNPAGRLDVHGSGSTAIIKARRLDGNGGYNLFEGYSDVNAASIFYVSNNGLGYFKDKVLIGTTTEGQASADDLTIATSGNTGITLRSGTSNAGNIYFSDATSGTAEYAGYISYSHSTNSLSFGTNDGTERMVLGSGGQLTVDVGAPGSSNKVIGRFQAQSSRALDIVWHDSGSLMGFDTPGDHSYIFKCNGTERMRLTAAGRLGINSDANGPDKLLHVSDTNNADVVTPFRLTNAAGSAGTEVRMEFECGLDEIAYISAKHEGSDTGPLIFATASSQGAYPTEKMRLTKNGALLINSTSQGSDELFKIFTDSTGPELIQLRNNSAGTKDMITMMNVNNSGATMIRFKQTGGLTNVGSITTSASATAFNTSSDYRLKENEVLISDGITRLKTLKPYRFNFKTEPSKTVDGFFAHEVTAVPEAVTGEKDAVETTYYAEGDTIPEGKAIGDIKEENVVLPQSLDYAKFTPLLTAALQEAVTRIETLEAQIAALTGG